MNRISRGKPDHDGYLSEGHGFLPTRLPKTRMDEAHRAWDDYAAQIPELFFSQSTQKILTKMPLLSAAESDLPWKYLPRAALLLSLLASAYWRHGIDHFFSIRISEVSSYLPDNILMPWLEVTRRLSRISPYQSATDLFFSNFRFLDDSMEYRLENLLIENITTLVPSFGNQAERVFYMSFVEIHAHTSPILRSMTAIQNAMFINDGETSCEVIEKELQNIRNCLQRATQTLLKINPSPNSRTYCDPILWAKTVAIFAVPAPHYQQGGTSGASTPFVHVLDAFLNRQSYKSFYGQYVKHEGKFLLPEVFKGLLEAIRAAPLNKFILGYSSIPLRRRMAKAYDEVVQAYVGPEGFMGKHFSKVFNYLAVATLVGRNQSTSGHERYIPAETWVEVTHDLQISAAERKPLSRKISQGSSISAISAPVAAFKAEPDDNRISYLELARHHYPEDAWTLIEGNILNVSNFLEKHPGGSEILLSYCGRDATAYFQIIPGHEKIRDSLLKNFKVGFIADLPVENTALESWNSWKDLLDYLLKIYAVIRIQFDHPVEARLKWYFNIQTHYHFLFDHLEVVLLKVLSLLDLEVGNEKVQKTLGQINEIREQTPIHPGDLRGDVNLVDEIPEFRRTEKIKAADLILMDHLIDRCIESMVRRFEEKLNQPVADEALTLMDEIAHWADLLRGDQ